MVRLNNKKISYVALRFISIIFMVQITYFEFNSKVLSNGLDYDFERSADYFLSWTVGLEWALTVLYIFLTRLHILKKLILLTASIAFYFLFGVFLTLAYFAYDS